MPTGRITQRAVEGIEAQQRDQYLWDSQLTGFGVKTTPAGAKVYIVQYRMAGRESPTQRWTLGRHGILTAAEARKAAEEILRLVAMGTDPKIQEAERREHERQQAIEAERLEFSSYAELFLERYAKPSWASGTFANGESNLRRWVTPVLKGRSVGAITRRDLQAIFDALPAGSPALPRNLFALIRKLFSWAVQRGDIERSPFDQMTSPPSVADRERVLSDDELFFVAACAGDLKPPFGAFVRLLILTGQRRSEVSDMEWNELNQEAELWVIPAARTKNRQQHRIPLNRIAVAELNQLAGAERWPGSGYVFSTNQCSPISGYSKAKKQLDIIISRVTGVNMSPWRLHDLRRTFATNMQRLGVRFEVTEALLNHVGGAKSGVAGVYQRYEWFPEKAQALESWAVFLSSAVEARQPVRAPAAS